MLSFCSRVTDCLTPALALAVLPASVRLAVDAYAARNRWLYWHDIDENHHPNPWRTGDPPGRRGRSCETHPVFRQLAGHCRNRLRSQGQMALDSPERAAVPEYFGSRPVKRRTTTQPATPRLFCLRFACWSLQQFPLGANASSRAFTACVRGR